MEQGYNFRRAGQRPPWLEGEQSAGGKIGLLILWGFSAMFGLLGLAFALAAIGQVRRSESALGPMQLAGLVCLALAIAGFWFAVPRLRQGTRFTPGYAPIPPQVPGQIFEARFRRPGVKRAFQGEGAVYFHPQHLIVNGHLAPPAQLQAVVILVLTLLPLAALGQPGGLLPAAIVAYFVGRKKWSCSIPYHMIRDLTVTGCNLRFTCAEMQPQVFNIQLSSADGERLYNELGARFPAALPPWQG